MEQNMGRIFNIQRFSVHDGPGIRTTVFLKGCSLRCAWCHNPESFETGIQIRYQPERCVECGMCTHVCPNGVYVRDKKRVNQEACTVCKRCVEECPCGALNLWGEDKEAEEVLRIVRRDIDYFRNSNGGVTVSGGEPLLQPDFVGELFRRAKEEKIHTALDTAASVPYGHFEKVLPYTDLVLLDLKIMDADVHKQYTGVSNDQILKNAERLFKSGIPIHIRVPLIKGINDSEENAYLLKEFTKGYSNIEEIKLLPYQSMGIPKAESIGIDLKTFEAPEEASMERIRQILGTCSRTR